MRDTRTPSTEMKPHAMEEDPANPLLLLKNHYTNWIHGYPSKTEDTSETACLQVFFLPSQQPEVCSLTNAKRVRAQRVKTCKVASRHGVTPHRSETKRSGSVNL